MSSYPTSPRQPVAILALAASFVIAMPGASLAIGQLCPHHAHGTESAHGPAQDHAGTEAEPCDCNGDCQGAREVSAPGSGAIVLAIDVTTTPRVRPTLEPLRAASAFLRPYAHGPPPAHV